MADVVDISNDFLEEQNQREIESIRKKSQIPVGVQGDCDYCGEWSGRLINDACAPCRDRRGLA